MFFMYLFCTDNYNKNSFNLKRKTSAILNITLNNRHFASSLYRLYTSLAIILYMNNIGSI